MSEPETTKRRRSQRPPSPQYRIDDDDDYEPYVPVAQRRQAKLAKLSALGSSTSRDNARAAREAEEEQEDEEKEEERRREKVRKGRALLVEAQEVHSKKASEGACCGSVFYQGYSTQVGRCQKDRGREGRRGGCPNPRCNSQQKKACIGQRAGQRYRVHRDFADFVGYIRNDLGSWYA